MFHTPPGQKVFYLHTAQGSLAVSGELLGDTELREVLVERLNDTFTAVLFELVYGYPATVPVTEGHVGAICLKKNPHRYVKTGILAVLACVVAWLAGRGTVLYTLCT